MEGLKDLKAVSALRAVGYEENLGHFPTFVPCWYI